MSTRVISSEATFSFGISSERINKPEPLRSAMLCRKGRPYSSIFAMRSLQATIYIFSWLRIERRIEIHRWEPFYSVVAGEVRDSSADPIMIAESCRSGLVLSPRQDFLPKARLVRSEGEISYMATQQVWSFSPSPNPARTVSESSRFLEYSNRLLAQMSDECHCKPVTKFSSRRIMIE